jgi:ribose transport system permease protein
VLRRALSLVVDVVAATTDEAALGRGGVWGTSAGVLLLAVLDASFNMLDVSAYRKLVLRGAIVIAVVAVYTIRSRELAA